MSHDSIFYHTYAITDTSSLAFFSFVEGTQKMFTSPWPEMKMPVTSHFIRFLEVLSFVITTIARKQTLLSLFREEGGIIFITDPDLLFPNVTAVVRYKAIALQSPNTAQMYAEQFHCPSRRREKGPRPTQSSFCGNYYIQSISLKVIKEASFASNLTLYHVHLSNLL